MGLFLGSGAERFSKSRSNVMLLFLYKFLVDLCTAVYLGLKLSFVNNYM